MPAFVILLALIAVFLFGMALGAWLGRVEFRRDGRYEVTTFGHPTRSIPGLRDVRDDR